MSRRPFIAGNWKLNLGPTSSFELATSLTQALAHRGNVDVAIFPTTVSLTETVRGLEGSGIGVGPQEICTASSGAFTGANSADMARALGCTHVLIGHSERRQLFGETDEGVNAKVHTALASGLLPVVCLGETLSEREDNRVEEVVYRQLSAALANLTPDQVATITLAYEPVWAIGTGKVASPEQAQAVHHSLRRVAQGQYACLRSI